MSRGREGWCEHYRGLFNGDTCAAGVKYADVTDVTTKPHSLPCIQDWNIADVKCEKCEYPTAEQIAAREEESNKLFERIGKVRAAIVESLGGPWKKGTKGSAGVIACPCCVTGIVSFSRSGYNGHIHARCSTENCAAWME